MAFLEEKELAKKKKADQDCQGQQRDCQGQQGAPLLEMGIENFGGVGPGLGNTGDGDGGCGGGGRAGGVDESRRGAKTGMVTMMATKQVRVCCLSLHRIKTSTTAVYYAIVCYCIYLSIVQSPVQP